MLAEVGTLPAPGDWPKRSLEVVVERIFLGLADELIVTVAPRIAGGRLAITLVEGDGFDTIAKGTKLKLSKVERRRDGELVLYYKIQSTF